MGHHMTLTALLGRKALRPYASARCRPRPPASCDQVIRSPVPAKPAASTRTGLLRRPLLLPFVRLNRG